MSSAHEAGVRGGGEGCARLCCCIISSQSAAPLGAAFALRSGTGWGRQRTAMTLWTLRVFVATSTICGGHAHVKPTAVLRRYEDDMLRAALFLLKVEDSLRL